jgi:hypothetical protein
MENYWPACASTGWAAGWEMLNLAPVGAGAHGAFPSPTSATSLTKRPSPRLIRERSGAPESFEPVGYQGDRQWFCPRASFPS